MFTFGKFEGFNMSPQLLLCILIFPLFLSGCTYPHTPQEVAMGSEVGTTGKIRFEHKALGGGSHLLTVQAAPGILETEESMGNRMLVFANEFAAKTCVGKYNYLGDPNPEYDNLLVRRQKVYTFRCVYGQ
jgi:hypothetical protein